MILIIMRHGDAGEYSSPDHSRPLTAVGKVQSQRVGKWLHNTIEQFLSATHTSDSLNDTREPAVDLAIVSPYLRTQQTFRAVNAGIKVHNQVTIDTITPMGNAQQTADLIQGYASDINAPKSMLVITHMPLVSLLADKVCADFNARIFETADTLIIDYNTDNGWGEQLAFYQGH
ncbi:MAG: phosphohistidine phosphatase SixA [Glaciecola sp.]